MTNAVRLIQGDCLEVLPTLGAGSVDAVVTDPPYSSVTHDGARGGDGGRKLITTFGCITADQFLWFCGECVRVARRWVVMTCDWRHAAAAEAAGLPVVRCGVWVKLDPFAGSGTTGVVAAQEGRRAVLIEREPAYCDIIRKRLAAVDGPLFAGSATCDTPSTS